ncbi:MAG: leucine-rich repeat domain-containing protein [Candidatus Rhabdochlamydia sp.]
MKTNINNESKSLFKTILKQWKEQALPEENRIEAENRILDFFNCKEKNYLDLSNLNLHSLPDIFNDLRSKLTHLDLNGNPLTNLPNTVINLTALKQLNINNKNLITFPDIVSCLSTLLIKNQLDNDLKSWKEDPRRRSSENRVEATNRILDFFNSNEKDSLDLSNLDLRSLPDIFNHPYFTYRLKKLLLNDNELIKLPITIGSLPALEELNLNDNHLTLLPDTIGNLSALEELSIDNNELSFLPVTIGNLSALKDLRLDENELEQLPDTIGNLSMLEYLSLDDNQLSFLPIAIGNLSALKELYLNNNELISLPITIGNLSMLKYLSLDDNQLRSLPIYIGNLSVLEELSINSNELTHLPNTIGSLLGLQKLELNNNELRSVPDTIGNLTALEYLYLNNNQLVNLPITIGNLSALETLYLFNNVHLSGVPMQILDLPRTCSIILTGCNLSMAVRTRLREATLHSDYAGPAQIEYSIVDAIRDEEQSIQDSLIALYRIIDETPKTFSNLEETLTLNSWLHRLSDIADYQKDGELQKAFAHKIIGYLNQANENLEFRKTFYTIIQDAAETCGDRMSLSVLHLGIAYKLSIIDLKDMKRLSDFLKGVWALDLLEEIARNKIPTIPFFDEIEVYLGYPIKLKEALNLPIDVQEMLYFTCSALNPADLEEAKTFVLNKQTNQEAYFTFLINHDKWKEALSLNYQEKYQAILDKKTEALELENPNYEDIEEKYKKGLKELTKRALLKRQSTSLSFDEPKRARASISNNEEAI